MLILPPPFTGNKELDAWMSQMAREFVTLSNANRVDSKAIQVGAVSESKLADKAVSARTMADASVPERAFQPDSIPPGAFKESSVSPSVLQALATINTAQSGVESMAPDPDDEGTPEEDQTWLFSVSVTPEMAAGLRTLVLSLQFSVETTEPFCDLVIRVKHDGADIRPPSADRLPASGIASRFVEFVEFLTPSQEEPIEVEGSVTVPQGVITSASLSFRTQLKGDLYGFQ